jgi:hypothetical protein
VEESREGGPLLALKKLLLLARAFEFEFELEFVLVITP